MWVICREHGEESHRRQGEETSHMAKTRLEKKGIIRASQRTRPRCLLINNSSQSHYFREQCGQEGKLSFTLYSSPFQKILANSCILTYFVHVFLQKFQSPTFESCLFVEARSHCVVLTSLELAMYTMLVLN